MNVIAMGRTQTLYDSIEAIHDAGHTVSLIVTCPAEPHYTVTVDDFQPLADRIDAEFLETGQINEDNALSVIAEHEPDVGISVNWKTLIGHDVRGCFEHGIINAHTGDLPRYRGNAATNWALVREESEIGYTLHFMVDELDAGPILRQRYLSVDEHTHIADVYEFGRRNYPEMFVDALRDIEEGTLHPRPQPSRGEDILRCYPRHPVDSELDWDDSADRLAAIVRASSEPLFGAYTYYEGNRIRIWRAHSELPAWQVLGTPGQVAGRRPESGEVAIVTGEGFLVLEIVEAPDTNGRMPATELIESSRDRLGVDYGTELLALRERVAELEARLGGADEVPDDRD